MVMLSAGLSSVGIVDAQSVTPPLRLADRAQQAAPVWVDTNGVTIGRAAPVAGTSYTGGIFLGGVIFGLDGLTVVFPLTSTTPSASDPNLRGLTWLEGPLFFPVPNCVGNPLVKLHTGEWGSARETTVQRVGGRYIGYVGAASGGLLPYQSVMANGGQCTNNKESFDYLVLVEAEINFDVFWHPPFTLR
jgi:hypothetical protein